MRLPTEDQPPKSLLRHAGRAIADYAMIRAGDRVLLGLSGGKDSLSLLHLLRHFQRHAPVDFALGAVTVDPKIDGFDPAPLKAYVTQFAVPYFYREQALQQQAAQSMQGDSFCAYCARIKRGILYTTARQEGYNVIALAQHLDDLAESFLMSVFRGGRLQTMKAHYLIDRGDLRVIRPLVYARERQTADYAQIANLPVIVDNCPACFTIPTERVRMKNLLRAEERINPSVFKSLLHTMRPLMALQQPAVVK